MAIVTGTFSATGATDAVEPTKDGVNVSMTFAGTATVAIQWNLDGKNWTTIESFTSTTAKVVDSKGYPVRLNCTAYTNPVTYVIAPRT